jgi:hypothetical protein
MRSHAHAGLSQLDAPPRTQALAESGPGFSIRTYLMIHVQRAEPEVVTLRQAAEDVQQCHRVQAA